MFTKRPGKRRSIFSPLKVSKRAEEPRIVFCALSNLGYTICWLTDAATAVPDGACTHDDRGSFRIGTACAPCLELRFEHFVDVIGAICTPPPPSYPHPMQHQPCNNHAPLAQTSTYISLPIHSSLPPISALLPSDRDVPRSVAPTIHPPPSTPPAKSPAVTPSVSTPSTPPRQPASTSFDTLTPIAKHGYNPTPPDTSISSAFDTSASTAFARVLSDPDSDGEVGIGLTLLQDLADGGGHGTLGDLGEDPDSDGEDEEAKRTRREGREGLEREAEEVENKSRESLGRKRVSREQNGRASGSGSSHCSRPGSSGSDVDRLQYEDTETGHGSVDHDHHDQTSYNNEPISSPMSLSFLPAPAPPNPLPTRDHILACIPTGQG